EKTAELIPGTDAGESIWDPARTSASENNDTRAESGAAGRRLLDVGSQALVLNQVAHQLVRADETAEGFAADGRGKDSRAESLVWYRVQGGDFGGLRFVVVESEPDGIIEVRSGFADADLNRTRAAAGNCCRA